MRSSAYLHNFGINKFKFLVIVNWQPSKQFQGPLSRKIQVLKFPFSMKILRLHKDFDCEIFIKLIPNQSFKNFLLGVCKENRGITQMASF